MLCENNPETDSESFSFAMVADNYTLSTADEIFLNGKIRPLSPFFSDSNTPSKSICVLEQPPETERVLVLYDSTEYSHRLQPGAPKYYNQSIRRSVAAATVASVIHTSSQLAPVFPICHLTCQRPSLEDLFTSGIEDVMESHNNVLESPLSPRKKHKSINDDPYPYGYHRYASISSTPPFDSFRPPLNQAPFESSSRPPLHPTSSAPTKHLSKFVLTRDHHLSQNVSQRVRRSESFPYPLLSSPTTIKHRPSPLSLPAQASNMYSHEHSSSLCSNPLMCLSPPRREIPKPSQRHYKCVSTHSPSPLKVFRTSNVKVTPEPSQHYEETTYIHNRNMWDYENGEEVFQGISPLTHWNTTSINIQQKNGTTLSMSPKHKGTSTSSHENHYVTKHAQAESMKKKTFLPYTKPFFACIGGCY